MSPCECVGVSVRACVTGGTCGCASVSPCGVRVCKHVSLGVSVRVCAHQRQESPGAQAPAREAHGCERPEPPQDKHSLFDVLSCE